MGQQGVTSGHDQPASVKERSTAQAEDWPAAERLLTERPSCGQRIHRGCGGGGGGGDGGVDLWVRIL